MVDKKQSAPVKASTQLFIEIEDIREDIILMRDFSAATVLEVGAVNFWLLSQDEQKGMIASYQNLLNSLSFPVQILVLSKRMDISSYLDYLKSRITAQKDERLKELLSSYQEFIKTTVKKTSVLEKRFFFVVPFSPLELGASGANPKKLEKEYVISRAKTSLYPKRDNLVRLLARIGLKAAVMQQQPLVELFYNLYNPSSAGRALGPIEGYTPIIIT